MDLFLPLNHGEPPAVHLEEISLWIASSKVSCNFLMGSGVFHVFLGIVQTAGKYDLFLRSDSLSTPLFESDPIGHHQPICMGCLGNDAVIATLVMRLSNVGAWKIEVHHFAFRTSYFGICPWPIILSYIASKTILSDSTLLLAAWIPCSPVILNMMSSFCVVLRVMQKTYWNLIWAVGTSRPIWICRNLIGIPFQPPSSG